MRVIFLFLVVFLTFSVKSQENFNIDLVAHVPNAEPLSDVWGYVDGQGVEYAIIGTRASTEIYSLEDPSNPNLVAKIPGAVSVWRDIKSLGNYLYVTTDQGTDGLVIIDMSEAPENITSTKVNPIVNGTAINKCHNLYIDTTSQIMFLAGCNDNRGVLAFDITTDPLNPSLLQIVSENYSHDVFVRDNLAFSSEIFEGEIAIYDISELELPQRLGSAKTTTLFTHNAWSDESNTYLYTTDEKANGTIDAYDISDPTNPIRIDAFVPPAINGLGIIPHNTHWQDNYLITSWYDYGIVITDVSNPNAITEVGHYNTGENPDCWGAYPFLPSGLILASDIANGLFVLQPDYVRAAYLSGIVTDESTGLPIFNAKIEIQAENPPEDRTDPKGEYAIGTLDPGQYTIKISEPNYLSKEVEVELRRNETFSLNVELEKAEIVTQKIKVIDGNTKLPIENVIVNLTKGSLERQILTDENGEVNDMFPAGAFDLVIGKWGYQYDTLSEEFTMDNEYLVELLPGYQDDFIFDYEWTTEASNSRSRFVRERPVGTTFAGEISNPSMDVDGDIGSLCYITGNGSGGAGQFDVDDGFSILTSPHLELADAEEPILSFYAWFFNAGGSGVEPNDTFKILAKNAVDTVLIDLITENTAGWVQKQYTLSDFIDLDDSVQIIFSTSDQVETGHLVEAGVDGFQVTLDSMVSSVNADLEQHRWKMYPNPAQSMIYFENEEVRNSVRVNIHDTAGRLISDMKKSGHHFSLETPNRNGIYYVTITDEEGNRWIKKLTVMR